MARFKEFLKIKLRESVEGTAKVTAVGKANISALKNIKHGNDIFRDSVKQKSKEKS